VPVAPLSIPAALAMQHGTTRNLLSQPYTLLASKAQLTRPIQGSATLLLHVDPAESYS